MKPLSKSPDRNTFQKDCYIKRCIEEEEPIDQGYLDLFENMSKLQEQREADPEWAKNNLEYDLKSTDWILEKVRASEAYSQNLYAAMCNNDFQKLEVIPILKQDLWSCSWRYAGGIVADMRQQGDYIDWYCSGMGGLNQDYDGNETNEEWQNRTRYVPESFVTEEIRNDLKKLGWVVVDNDS